MDANCSLLRTGLVTTHEARHLIPMDPVTALSLVHTTVQLTSSCIKVCRKYVGPSTHSSADIQGISDDLWTFNAALKNLETYYGIYEEDQAEEVAEPIALPSIKEPLSHCDEALQSIKKHVESKKKFFTGARFDTALEKQLKCLKDSRILFKELLLMDLTYNTRLSPRERMLTLYTDSL